MQKILVIDDDKAFRRVIVAALKQRGFGTLEADSGAQGVELASSQLPDLIICDVNMSGGDGYFALETMRQAPALATIPFILITGQADRGSLRHGMELGADDYLAKPFLLMELFATIDARLKKHQAQRQQLEQTKARLVAILEATTDLVGITDLQGQMQYLNYAGRKMIGVTREEEVAKLSLVELFTDAERQRMEQEAIPAAQTEGLWAGESALHNHHGCELQVSLILQGHKGLEGHVDFLSVVARDFTQRKHAEEQLKTSREQLRAFSARLQAVREEERTRIAREIHDELGQLLTGLKMEVSWLANRLTDQDNPLVEKVQSMKELIDDGIRSVRKIATELRPGVLDNLGLIAAIEWQAQEFETRTGIQCRFSSNLEGAEVDSDRSTALFRIFQETITNVARHAQATQVHASLDERDGALVLEVRDTGKGITEKEIANPLSLGLLGIRERALLLGGEATIRGAPGQGTTVTVRIPRNAATPPATERGPAGRGTASPREREPA